MKEAFVVNAPVGFDWRGWIERWDRMQERYIPFRGERMTLMVELIRRTQETPKRVVDLGCGPGSLMHAILEALPDTQVIGVDFDPTLLGLARKRLEAFGQRVALVQADLRNPHWSDRIDGPCGAVVSATALHWLSESQLASLYGRLRRLLIPGGIFLNADHVGSVIPPVQRFWDDRRSTMLDRADPNVDDWKGFWRRFGEALGLDTDALHREIIGDWSGVEEGLPLSWHFERLGESGFGAVDCFWRSGGDAIYGGLRGDG